jgi:glycine cleavage system H protein
MKIIDGLYYSRDHEWLKVEGNIGYIGITDFAQDALGDIAYLELPQAGDGFSAGDVFGVVESVKMASDLLMPVSGTVLEKNEGLEEAPEGINEDPYANWLLRIEMKDAEEVAALLDAAGYTKLIEE